MEVALGILVVLLLLTGIVLCVVKPKYAFVAILMMFPMEQVVQGYVTQLIMRFPYAFNLLVGTVSLVSIVAIFRSGELPWKNYGNRAAVGLLAMYAYMAVAVLWTPSPDSAAHFWWTAMPYIGLLVFIAPMMLRSIDEWHSLILPAMVLGCVVAFFIFVNPKGSFLYGRYTIDFGYLLGYGELRSNPLALADTGAVMAILAMLYRPAKSTTLTLGIQIATLILGLGLALISGSRGQVVFALAIGFAFLPFVSSKRNLGQYFSLATLAVFGLIAVYFVYTTVLGAEGQSRWSAATVSQGANTRFQLASVLLQAYLERPLSYVPGLGTSSFNAYYSLPEQAHWYCHNIAVEALCEYGLIGFSIFMLTGFMTMKLAKQLWDLTKHDPVKRSATICLVALATLFLLLSLKQGSLIMPSLLYPLIIIIGRLALKEQEVVDAEIALAYESGMYDGQLGSDDQMADGYGDAQAEQGWDGYAGGGYGGRSPTMRHWQE